MRDIQTIKDSILKLIWGGDITSMPTLRARGIMILRIAYAVIRDIADGQITLRAMSLVYTTLLSLVPLLAVSFSVLKAFGVHNQVEPLLLNFLAPLGEKGIEITDRVIGFVENIRAGVLGSLGLAILLYTVVSLLQKIERAFNFIWNVPRQRPFAQRFSDYLSVIIVGPVLVFSAMGLTASVTGTSAFQSLTEIQPFGELVRLAGRVVPYLLVIAAFTFVYAFVPNTKVKLGSALVGGVVAGVLWESVGWIFASFVVGSTRYMAIYSAFATLIMFMIWLYLSWVILLVGASIAYYHQHTEQLTAHRRHATLSNRMKERLALLCIAHITRAHYHKERAWGPRALAHKLSVPQESIDTVIYALEDAGLLTRSADDPATYLPARALETVSLFELLEAVRSSGETPHFNPKHLPGDPVVDELTGKLDQAREEVLQGLTARDLLDAETATEVGARPRAVR